MEKTAIQELRMIRDIHLASTDWWGCSDRTMSAEQAAYRQSLRDLPANSTPSYDENGQLTGVNWPVRPNDIKE